MKTIAEILTETLKNKHITIYVPYLDKPVNSGIVKKVTIATSWDGESIVFLLDRGLESFVEAEYFFEDIKIEVC
ncbi:MAG TPA: hypothetical protein PLP33_25340 [Leptospiraceae bacterium]|nr:hypothetical protein [Leptospiraceae bacterium]